LALSKRTINKGTDKRLTDEFGSSDYERLEFLGDRVLDLIVSEYLFNDFNITNPGSMSKKLSHIVRNTSLSCYVHNQNLCGLIIPYTKETSKACADLFESILGAAYYHLKLKQYPHIIEFLTEWLETKWNFKNIVKYVIESPDPDVCEYIGEKSVPENGTADLVIEKRKIDEYTKKYREIYEIDILEKLVEDKIKSYQDELNTLSDNEIELQYRALAKLRKVEKDPKTQLKEIFENNKWGVPNYRIYKSRRRSKGYWEIGVLCPLQLTHIKCINKYGDRVLGMGSALSKKEAEKKAAKESLKVLL
jgi:dsRNA-specific ribonuclease